MAGEGVFGTMLGRFAGGLTDAQDRQRKQAQIEAQQKRQATLDADAMQTSALERAAGQFKLGQAQEQADADKTFPDLFAKARAGDEGALGSVLRRYPQMAGALTKPEPKRLVVPAGASVMGEDGKTPLYTNPKEQPDRNEQTINATEGVFVMRDGPDGIKVPVNVATGRPWIGGTLHPVSMQPNFSFPVVTGEGGAQVVARANTKTGDITPTNVNAKASGAGSGALGNRQKDYVSLMTNALPEMERLSPKVNSYTAGAALKDPMLANPLLDEDSRQYLVHAKDFLAGVLHEESGARLSDSQIAWGTGRYLILPGDSPATRQIKIANAKAVAKARAENINYVPPGAPLSETAKAELSTASAGSGATGGTHNPVGRKAPPRPSGATDAEWNAYLRDRGYIP